MFNERPSQRKVVGVARKYLKHLERREEIAADLYRFEHEDLSFERLYAMSFVLGAATVVGMIAQPFQSMRSSFLEHAREVEGRRPGEESLATFALNKLSSEEQQGRFPRVLSSERGD